MSGPGQESAPGGRPPRRKRYAGTHPRRFDEKYKEHNPQAHPGIVEEVRARGATPAGTHIPVLVEEVLAALDPQAGEIVADCTLGFGGHASEFLRRIGPTGRLLGFDVDGEQLERTRQRLIDIGTPLTAHRSNFAGLAKVFAQEKLEGVDIILADLGVSSMQIDDPRRGFTYKFDGPLDMRMDERKPQTAADLLATLPAQKIAAALWEFADEPDHKQIARAIVAEREQRRIRRTSDLVRVVFEAKGMTVRDWRDRPDKGARDLHPAARTFQALRILVNEELNCLRQLLRSAPACLRPAGRIGIISFHSGEDSLVEAAFKEGLHAGVYSEVSPEAIRATSTERYNNPRATPARFRWARRGP